MDYFFTKILPIMMAVFLVVMIIFDFINHFNKKKLIKYVLASDERRQVYIRVDTIVLSTYKKVSWLFLEALLVIAFGFYYFLPDLFYSSSTFFIEAILFYVVVVDDYFYRKSFLKAIDKPIENSTNPT